jgi:hypothetical protein
MAEIISSIIIVAIIFALIRPGSKGPDAVVSFGHAFAAIITTAIG